MREAVPKANDPLGRHREHLRKRPPPTPCFRDPVRLGNPAVGMRRWNSLHIPIAGYPARAALVAPMAQWSRALGGWSSDGQRLRKRLAPQVANAWWGAQADGPGGRCDQGHLLRDGQHGVTLKVIRARLRSQLDLIATHVRLSGRRVSTAFQCAAAVNTRIGAGCFLCGTPLTHPCFSDQLEPTRRQQTLPGSVP